MTQVLLWSISLWMGSGSFLFNAKNKMTIGISYRLVYYNYFWIVTFCVYSCGA